MLRIGTTAIILGLLPYSASAATLESGDNFIVMVATGAGEDAKLSRTVRERANQFRDRIAKEWLGEELPSGIGRTAIHVKLSTEKDTGLTWARTTADRTLHNVFLTTSREGAVGTTLAHEMAHIVLATEFAHPNRLAPWIEEGIASQYDDAARKAKREKVLAWFARSDNWPQLVDVINAESISTNDQSAYSVASSITELLVSRSDKQTFIRFARDAQSVGWESALRTHYNIRGVAALEQMWRASLK